MRKTKREPRFADIWRDMEREMLAVSRACERISNDDLMRQADSLAIRARKLAEWAEREEALR